VLSNIVLRFAALSLPSLIFTTRKNADEYTQRLISIRSGVPISAVLSPLSDNQYASLSAALSEVADHNIYFDESCEHTLETFRERCIAQKTQCGALPLIVIDSLEFVGFENSPRLGRYFKMLAMELESTVIVARAIKRNTESRVDKRPRLTDLEHDELSDMADIIMLVYKRSLFEIESGEGDLELIVAQNKAGPVGTVTMASDMFTGRIFELPHMPTGDSNDF
jgi:replicative DNA helicase